jgi:hypothetical protein
LCAPTPALKLDGMESTPSTQPQSVVDDALTLCAISILACMLSTMLHGGLGHAVIAGVAGLFNPFGMRYVLLSPLAGSAGGGCGLLWLRYYIPRSIQPGPNNQSIPRSYAWIAVSIICAAIFIGVFGPGIHLRG